MSLKRCAPYLVSFALLFPESITAAITVVVVVVAPNILI